LSASVARTQLNRTLAILKVNLANEKLPTEIQEITLNLESTQKLISDLSTNNQQIKKVTFNFLVTARSHTELKTLFQDFSRLAQTLNFSVSGNFLHQKQCFQNLLSFSENSNSLSQSLSCDSLAASYPFQISSLVDPNGFYLGDLQNGSFSFNIFHQTEKRINSNMFILGTSGSGKSFTARKLIKQLLNQNHQVFVLDPEREYSSLVNSSNPNYSSSLFNLGGENNIQLNPFNFFSSSQTPNNLAEHLQFLESFFQLVLKDISFSDLRGLRKHLSNFYRV
jgi:type IV secretory pathway VirB4 component